MKTRILVYGTLIALGIAGFVFRRDLKNAWLQRFDPSYALFAEDLDWTPEKRIPNLIKVAKARGQKRVEFGCGTPSYMEVNLNQALEVLSIVVVKPRRSKVILPQSDIFTWTSFEVSEYLKENPARRSVTRAPLEFQSSNPKFLAIQTCGGRMLVDGIELIQHGPLEGKFDLEKTYLLFVDRGPAQTAWVIYRGAYEVSSKGGLTPVGRYSQPREMATLHIDSLEKFRAEIKRREKAKLATHPSS
jgi:hypothetical protein